MLRKIVRTLLLVLSLLLIILLCSLTSSCKDIDPPYEITYKLNGGKFNTNYSEVIPKEYDGTRTIALPTWEYVYKTGCVFAGWFETANFTSEEIKYIKKGETSDKKFYAKWAIDKYYNEGANN